MNLKTWEVLAYLAGRKTMIARPVVWPTWADPDRDGQALRESNGLGYFVDGRPRKVFLPPVGSPGDVLAGKEAWAYSLSVDDEETPDMLAWVRKYGHVWYRADPGVMQTGCGGAPGRWRPAQHMPPWSVRIHLGVEAVTAKRVSQITASEFWGLGLDVFAPNAVGTWQDVLGMQWDADYPRFPWAPDRWLWLARAPRVTP